MLHTKKEVYLTYRGAFAPERAKLVIVAEFAPGLGTVLLQSRRQSH